MCMYVFVCDGKGLWVGAQGMDYLHSGCYHSSVLFVDYPMELTDSPFEQCGNWSRKNVLVFPCK